MANIRDVARLARVSPATVSRILNDNQVYKTTDATRERVLRAVTELGYQPLMKKNSPPHEEQRKDLFSVGCLLATTEGKYTDPYYLSILGGIETELARLGGTVSLIQTEQELEQSAVLERLLRADLSGLVMMRPLAEPLFNQLQAHIPHIVGIDTGHMPIDNVEYDHRRVSKMAVEYLYGKGHRQIGFIGGSPPAAPLKASRRYRSYLETMADLGLPVREEWVIDCAWDARQCEQLIQQTQASFGLPSAFYAASDLMAMAALRALYRLGIRVPEQVAVIGMSNLEMSRYANPPLTTIDVPTVEMGIAAARILTQRIQGDTTLPKRVLLPSRLIERDSA